MSWAMASLWLTRIQSVRARSSSHQDDQDLQALFHLDLYRAVHPDHPLTEAWMLIITIIMSNQIIAVLTTTSSMTPLYFTRALATKVPSCHEPWTTSVLPASVRADQSIPSTSSATAWTATCHSRIFVHPLQLPIVVRPDSRKRILICCQRRAISGSSTRPCRTAICVRMRTATVRFVRSSSSLHSRIVEVIDFIWMSPRPMPIRVQFLIRSLEKEKMVSCEM